MSSKIIQQRLDSYRCGSALEEDHALREITQEAALAALGRTGFFTSCVFQGGTCLRIFYGLNRFSEDLDFILDKPDPSFELAPYLESLSQELTAFGFKVEVSDRSKLDNVVRKAFIKDDSIGKLLHLNYASQAGPFRKINIKLELDTNPPAGSRNELKYLDFPFVSSVTVQDKPSLFAGKLHALLCRPYIKGRDWYDFLWYTSQRVPVNLGFLAAALRQQGPWQGQELAVDLAWCKLAMAEVIHALDWKKTADDVRRFVRASELASLDLWSAELFLSRLDKL